MTILRSNSLSERDAEQAITALKRGSYLLKYGQRGNPKFCPFRLSSDETTLIWYTGKQEKEVQLRHVSRIIPGQRTAVFQRYPRPEKECQSFSLIYNKGSLDLRGIGACRKFSRGHFAMLSHFTAKPCCSTDHKVCRFEKLKQNTWTIEFASVVEHHLIHELPLMIRHRGQICKDKDEAEIWFVALRALLSRGKCQLRRCKGSSDSLSSDGSSDLTRRSQSFISRSSSDIVHEEPRSTQATQGLSENLPRRTFGRSLSELLLYDSDAQFSPQREFDGTSHSLQSSQMLKDIYDRNYADTSRLSSSSALSSSGQGSPLEDLDTSGDIFIWGEGICDGLVGGGVNRTRSSTPAKDALYPKVLGSVLALNIKKISCGSKHAVIVTKQGEIYSWGDGSGGRLGHGVDADVPNPMPIGALSKLDIESVSCGENHTSAITVSGDLYTWGDGIHNYGLLGHGNEFSQWIPKRVSQMEALHVSVISCGPWHSAVVTETGLLFTFGEGAFGALGHGDRCSTSVPREVEALKGLRAVRVGCGVWHTAAILEIISEPLSCDGSSTGHLFTWGDGNKGQLGHGDEESKLVPSCVTVLNDKNLCQVACGHSITVTLTTLGKVYTMGSAKHGQLGSPGSPGKLPVCVEGELTNNFIGEIACGSHHVAVLSLNYEIYTWGKGSNGQLGHGDIDDRNTPTRVKALIKKQVKSVVCGPSVTAVICCHKQVSVADYHLCSSCRSPFNFRRTRHHCYNCGLVFCKACSSKKSVKASLAPNMNKPYRVCEICFAKLNNTVESKSTLRPPKVTNGSTKASSGETKDQETLVTKSDSVLSRLSSFGSFRRLSNPQCKMNAKQDLRSGSPIQNASLQKETSYTSHPSPSIYELSQNISPLPRSTTNSRTSSPVSMNSDPRHSTSLAYSGALAYPDVMIDDSKRTNDNHSKEISILREQVEVLAYKSKLLETELSEKSKRLIEATDTIRDEKARNEEAMELIRSLKTQNI